MRLRKPGPDAFSDSAWPGQRWPAGTLRMTWSTCWPQPAHVVLPQVLQVAARHMSISLVDIYPWGYAFTTTIAESGRASKPARRRGAARRRGVPSSRRTAQRPGYGSAAPERCGVGERERRCWDGSALLPVGAEAHDVAHDDDCGGPHATLAGELGDGADRADRGALVGPEAALDDRDGAVGRPAVPGEQLGRAGELGDTHEQDERVVAARREHRDVLVARDDGEAARDAAVGHGYAGRRGHADSARHAGHHLDPNAVCLAGVALLAAAAEDVGVAALEAHDAEAALGLLDEEVVDARLRHRVVAGGLADVDDAYRGRQPVDDGAGRETVDDDDVGRGEQLVAACGQEAVDARAAADERHPAATAVRAGAAQVERARDERQIHPVADRHGETGAPGGIRSHGNPTVGGRHVGAGSDARGRADGVRGVDAPDAQRLGVGGDLAVDGRLARRRVGEPRAGEVSRSGVVALEPLDAAGVGQVVQVLAQPGGDDPYDRALVEEGPDPARGHGPATDGDDEPTGQVEDDRQGRFQISHSSSPSGCVGASAAVGSVAPTMPAATVRPSCASMSRNDPPRREVE